jgi:hypothetical protein
MCSCVNVGRANLIGHHSSRWGINGIKDRACKLHRASFFALWNDGIKDRVCKLHRASFFAKWNKWHIYTVIQNYHHHQITEADVTIEENPSYKEDLDIHYAFISPKEVAEFLNKHPDAGRKVIAKTTDHCPLLIISGYLKKDVVRSNHNELFGLIVISGFVDNRKIDTMI